MTTTAQPDYPALIRKAGWEPESDSFDVGGYGSPPIEAERFYRATQGPFSTPWMATWQEVLEWIEKGKKCS